MNKINKIKFFLDKPIIWFLFVLIAGEMIIEESYGDGLSSALIFIFAVIIWQYERRKQRK